MQPTFTLLGGRLTLHQQSPRPPEDALWLIASIPTLPENTPVLDAGCGTGIAGLALLARQPQLHVTGLDINPTLTTQAKRNATLNNLQNNYKTLTQNLLQPINPSIHQSFPIILSNPPFYPTETHTPSTHQHQAKSTTQADFHNWLQALHTLLPPTHQSINPSIHLILHPSLQNTLEIFAQNHACHLTLTPLQTAPQKAPKRLLAQLIHGYGLTENPPLPIHQKSLRENILTHAQPL